MIRVVSSHPAGCENGLVSFDYFRGGESIKTTNFTVPSDFTVSGDLAAAAAIVCRPADDELWEFNFPVSPRAKAIAKRDYNIFIKASDALLPSNQPAKAAYLNFSGGVDSLAAHYLLGTAVHLLSIDFGGAFTREANWFSHWDTYIVASDLRKKPFVEGRDWRFMAAGAMLFRDYLGIGSLYWGTVLEASPYWLSNNQKREPRTTEATHAFGMAQLKTCQAITPLSEYGTMKVALKWGEEVLTKSIESCSSPGSEKLFRKRLLRSIAAGETFPSENVLAQAPCNKHKFGTAFGPDVLTAYFFWRYGSEFVSDFLAELSADARMELGRLNMEFFERYNPANLATIPSDVRGSIVAEYLRCGIHPYTCDDVRSLEECRSFLRTFHGF